MFAAGQRNFTIIDDVCNTNDRLYKSVASILYAILLIRHKTLFERRSFYENDVLHKHAPVPKTKKNENGEYETLN